MASKKSKKTKRTPKPNGKLLDSQEFRYVVPNEKAKPKKKLSLYKRLLKLLGS